jgi:hypothetical protein
MILVFWSGIKCLGSTKTSLPVDILVSYQPSTWALDSPATVTIHHVIHLLQLKPYERCTTSIGTSNPDLVEADKLGNVLITLELEQLGGAQPQAGDDDVEPGLYTISGPPLVGLLHLDFEGCDHCTVCAICNQTKSFPRLICPLKTAPCRH